MNWLNRLPVGYWLIAIAVAFAGGVAVDDVKLDAIHVLSPAKPQPTAVAYVYEKDEHAIPAPVQAAISRLNSEGRIIAVSIEADVKDGLGDVPKQFKAALAAAKEAGLPALVVTSGDEVLRIVANPKDEQAVLDAAK